MFDTTNNISSVKTPTNANDQIANQNQPLATEAMAVELNTTCQASVSVYFVFKKFIKSTLWKIHNSSKTKTPIYMNFPL